jgi:hypothetical protein
MADASFFSGIVEGSGFAVGEAVFVVILVAVAVGFGMSRDSLLEYVGTKIHGFFRKKKAASEVLQSPWQLPSWARIAVWLLVTGLSGFLAWKAIPTSIERKADQLPTSTVGLPAGAVWNNEGNFAVVAPQSGSTQAPQLASSAPERRNYPDKADAKEALEDLHDILVKQVQHAIVHFPLVDVGALQRNLYSLVAMHTVNRPGQPQADQKEIMTGVVKNILDNHISALLEENSQIQSSTNAIYTIKAKQKAITANATEDFFTQTYPPPTFGTATSNLIVALRWFSKQDKLDGSIFDVLNGDYGNFERERSLFAKQIHDAIQRTAAEILAIDNK